LKNKFIVVRIFPFTIVIYTGCCYEAGRFLIKDDKPEHADAMVILMGNIPDQVLQALDLFNQRKANRIIIVEENMDASRYSWIKGHMYLVIQTRYLMCLLNF
jgi:hypothetical protein